MSPISSLRLFVILATLPVLTGVVSGVILFGYFTQQQIEQSDAFGHSTAAQLSDQLSQYMFDGDLVSLNVLATKLASKPYIDFVAVYDQQNALIAQSGQADQDAAFYTDEVTFQDSMIGFVRIAVQNEPEFPDNWWIIAAVVSSLYLITVWFLRDTIIRWLSPAPRELPVQAPPTIKLPVVSMPTTESILVLRIKPSHLLAEHFDTFHDIAADLEGVVEQTTPEELVVHFDCYDSLFKAVNCGLTVRAEAKALNSRIQFGGALNSHSEDTDEIRKAASYLASISEGDLILAADDPLIHERVELATYHHALVDSRELQKVVRLKGQFS